MDLLYGALISEDYDKIKTILQNDPSIDITQQFVWACGSGKYQIVDIFLKYGNVDVSKRDDATRMTMLMYVCNGGHYKGFAEKQDDLYKVADLLLKTGNAHPEYRDIIGNTALIYACENGYSNIADLLLRTGESHPETQS